MKRILSALLLAAVASTAFASAPVNDQYRNDAGQPDQHQPQVASADAYRPNAGESTDNNVVQSQVG
jgi:hypothetical protein